MRLNPQETVELVTFNEEIFNGKLDLKAPHPPLLFNSNSSRLVTLHFKNT